MLEVSNHFSLDITSCNAIGRVSKTHQYAIKGLVSLALANGGGEQLAMWQISLEGTYLKTWILTRFLRPDGQYQFKYDHVTEITDFDVAHFKRNGSAELRTQIARSLGIITCGTMTWSGLYPDFNMIGDPMNRDTAAAFDLEDRWQRVFM